MKSLVFISLIVLFPSVLTDITEFAKTSFDLFKDLTASDGLADKLISSDEPLSVLKEFGTSDVGKKWSKQLTSSEQTIAILTKVVTSDVAKDWAKKLGSSFKSIASISKKFAKLTGPAEGIITFALEITSEQHDENIEYLKNITDKLNKIDAKLDSISEQITLLDAKIAQSTKKVVLELKLQHFFNHFDDLTASQQHYESIVSGYNSNSTLLLYQLDKYIEDYRQQGSDTKLVNILDSGAKIINSIIDDLISFCRSTASGSSAMKNVYDIYITTFMKIMKANVILESAVNLKTALTGENYEEDRRYNHYRKNEIFGKFFSSFEKAFSKLDSNDIDGSIDLTVNNGDQSRVRMINVLQYFWENEDKLSIIDTCSDDCEHFQDREYRGGGCDGRVRNCKHGVRIYVTERYLRQNPQVDRIYEGYLDHSTWHGLGTDNQDNPNMEFKKSYPRGFFNCHVCKCVCDQYLNTESVRKIYTGKISAPDGYVVTGVRFIKKAGKKEKAIYPQIQVGKLLPLATVDQNSVTWLDPPDDRSFFDFGYDRREIVFGDPSEMIFTDSVVTGVRFESIFPGPSWSIYGRKLVDFNTGALGEETHIQTPENVNSINCERLIPGLNRTVQKFNIGYNAKVKFGVSDEANDAGQSFVPYFDGNEVSFDIKSPLSGITLIHYTNDGNYAGYIRPVIKSLNYKKFFNTSYRIDQFVPTNFADGKI